MGRLFGILTFFVLATLVATWPVGLYLTDHVVVPEHFIGSGVLPTSPDTYLHLWILTWVHHALTTAPAMLFDAPIMYPAEGALAGSEHMLAHWLIHGPAYAASANPVLAYQWLVFSSFVINGLSLYLVLRHWTGSVPAALLGGAIYAFAPLRFDLIGTVQHLNVAYLALLVLLADRYRSDGRARDLVGFFLVTTLQTLCSYYLAYATAVALGVLVVVTALDDGNLARRRAVVLACAALVGMLPLVAVSGPYLELRAAGVVPDYPEEWLRAASATPSWFLRRGMPLFAGYVPLALGAVGVVALVVRRREWGVRWRLGAILGIGLVGFILVLGPAATVFGRDVPLPYRALYDWIPGFSSLRYPYRFGTLTTLAIALLAGVGWAELVGRRPGTWPLALIGIAVIGLEYRQVPLTLTRVEVGTAVPPAYRWLEYYGQGRPLLEWPIAPRGDMRAGYQQSRVMYFSTYHRLPVVNGYTAYEPPSHELLFLLAQRLPEERSLRTFVDLSGAELLLLHRDRLMPVEMARWAAWIQAGGCQRLAEFGADMLCELPPQDEDLRVRLVAANTVMPRQTLRGLSLEPVDVAEQRGELAVHPRGGAVRAGLVARLWLTVTNRGAEPWPGLAPLVPGVVTVRHRWRPAGESGDVKRPWKATPILCDLEPGDSCDLMLPVAAPPIPAAYVLELAVGQHRGPAFVLQGGQPRVDLPLRALSLPRRQSPD